jgi:hypothetical protein
MTRWLTEIERQPNSKSSAKVTAEMMEPALLSPAKVTAIRRIGSMPT